jgi:hypothetical protein
MRPRHQGTLLAGTLLVSCFGQVATLCAQGAASAPSSTAGGQSHRAELKLEIVPEVKPRFDYGVAIHLLIQVENMTDSDLAVCWSSLPEWRIVRLEVFSPDGERVPLRPPGGEVYPHYLFSLRRDVMILPANGLQLITRDLNTRWLPRPGTCSTYLVSARYTCRAGLDTEWARSPRLCVGEYRSPRVEVHVDDRPVWKRMLGLGTCSPHGAEKGQPGEK